MRCLGGDLTYFLRAHAQLLCVLYRFISTNQKRLKSYVTKVVNSM